MTVVASSWLGSTHGCLVERNWLSTTILRQSKIPLAGLDPAIHVFLHFGDLSGQGVDARIKSWQGVLTVALLLATLDPALSQLLNRTAVGSTRLSCGMAPKQSQVTGSSPVMTVTV
jgi:hypothetical protein